MSAVAKCRRWQDFRLRALRHAAHSLSKGRAMTRAVSHRPLTMEARVRSQVSPCEIRGGQCPGTGFSPSTSVSPCQHHSTNTPTHLHLHVARTNGRSLGIFKKHGCFGNRGALLRKALC